MTEVQLIFRFINESKDFALGFECGRIYQDMKNATPKIEGAFHAENLEQIQLISQVMNYSIEEITTLNDIGGVTSDWVNLKFVDLDQE